MTTIEDLEAPHVCCSCGVELDPMTDRCFAIGVIDDLGESDLLCWDCAVAHGGVYDARRETWVKTPKMPLTEYSP